MQTSGSDNNRGALWVVLYTVLFLIFFQLIAEFVEGIYAFGLLGTGIPLEIIAVLFFFSPLILLFLPRGLSARTLVLLGALLLLCRLVEVLLDTRGRMLVAGLGVSTFMLILPALLVYLGRIRKPAVGIEMGAGLALALALSVLLRVLGSGSDVSTTGWSQWFGWFFALLGGVMLVRLLGGKPVAMQITRPDSYAGFGALLGITLGLISVLILLFFAFTAPNVIARWTEDSYLMIVSVLVLAMGLAAALFTARPKLVSRLSLVSVLIWNFLFVVSLVATLLAHQVGFPSLPQGYPLYQPQVASWAPLALRLMLLLSPVIIVNFSLYVRELVGIRPNPRLMGASFSLGAFFLLLMIFAHVFTTAYSYIPVVGSFFRDRFWLVYMLAGLGMALPVILVRRASFDFREVRPSGTFSAVLIVLGMVAIAGVWLTSAQPKPAKAGDHRLRVMTYNIQQGFSEAGQKNYAGQLALIEAYSPDILGLQESDTNRIAGGNSDVVRYFADRLNMYSYYGPTTVVGTFGIALLSRYPLLDPNTFYMHSEREQTATIVAQITIGGKTFNIYITHLGNGGPIIQQQAILSEVAGNEDVILVGDFNFTPDTEQYQLTRTVLDDAWLLKWPAGLDSRGFNPAKWIDHIFVSPGTTVAEAQYILDPESDHPALVVDITW